MGKNFSSRLRALRGIDRTHGRLPPQQKQTWERQEARKRERREREKVERRIEAATGAAVGHGKANGEGEPDA